MTRIQEELMAVAKVQARSQRRAVLISDVLRVDPDPDAMIVAPVKMAGESRLCAVAFGRRGQQPTFVFAPDARNRDAEAALTIKPLAEAIDSYFRECLARERAPQLWVSSKGVVSFLDALSERRNSQYDTNVALLGLRLHFATDRYFYAGQQVMMAATDALNLHFATGQSSLEDQHLGSLLAWLNPPADGNVAAAAREAEELPAGSSTDVVFDVETSKLLTELAEQTREGNSDDAFSESVAAIIGNGLETMATRVFGQIEKAIDALERQGLVRVDTMQKLRAEDVRSFSFFMQRGFVPLRASADDAARQLSAREAAIDRSANAFISADAIERAIGSESGEVIDGSLADFEYSANGRYVEAVSFTTEQAISKLRVGDTVRVDATKKIVLQLIDQSPPDKRGRRDFHFRVASGKTYLEPLLGEDVSLLPGSGGFFDRSNRSDVAPWITARDGQLPRRRAHAVPKDPVAALEGLK